MVLMIPVIRKKRPQVGAWYGCHPRGRYHSESRLKTMIFTLSRQDPICSYMLSPSSKIPISKKSYQRRRHVYPNINILASQKPVTSVTPTPTPTPRYPRDRNRIRIPLSTAIGTSIRLRSSRNPTNAPSKDRTAVGILVRLRLESAQLGHHISPPGS